MNQKTKNAATAFGISLAICGLMLAICFYMETTGIKFLVPELWTILVVLSIVMFFLYIGGILLLLFGAIEKKKVLIKGIFNKKYKKQSY